ncbi:MAG: 3-phosphoshikimate 1-carboxyvinyltransferase [Mahellales bacterium]|jgi:3-phosphoshikimate 1-carboxyvinyltransferase
MTKPWIKNGRPLSGTIQVPGDKSISHRAVMLGSISQGTTLVENFLMGDDCLSTISCLRDMGADIQIRDNNMLKITVRGLRGLRPPAGVLDAGNSGTTLRLLSGILAGQSFKTVITGDVSLQQRPMDRIIKPLSQMGARICGHKGTHYAPLTIEGSSLRGIEYRLPMASAQVKSAILLAGLFAQGPTRVIEPVPSRDHTELMLQSLGADIFTQENSIILKPGSQLTGRHIKIPGDISSAAFIITAALIVPGSDVIITNVGINNTRRGIIDVYRQMGADIELINQSYWGKEPMADIHVRYGGDLKATVIQGSIIPLLIDEIPAITVAACTAHGTTVIKDAAELKVKETNRIDILATELNKMGAGIRTTDDGLIIEGPRTLIPARVDSHGDHRMAMALIIASLIAGSETVIRNTDCINISFPGFFELMKKLQ